MAYNLSTSWGALLNQQPLPNGYFSMKRGNILILYKQKNSILCSSPLAFIDRRKPEVLITMKSDVILTIDGLRHEGTYIDEVAWQLLTLVQKVIVSRILNGVDKLDEGPQTDMDHPLWLVDTTLTGVFHEMLHDLGLKTAFLCGNDFAQLIMETEAVTGYSHPLPYNWAPKQISSIGCSTACLLELLNEGSFENGMFQNAEPIINRILDRYKADDLFGYQEICYNNMRVFRTYTMLKELFRSYQDLGDSMRIRRSVMDAIGSAGPTKQLNVFWEASDGIHSVSTMRNRISVRNGSFGEYQAKNDSFWAGLIVSSEAFSELPDTNEGWKKFGLYDGQGFDVLIPFRNLRKITDIRKKTLWSNETVPV